MVALWLGIRATGRLRLVAWVRILDGQSSYSRGVRWAVENDGFRRVEVTKSVRFLAAAGLSPGEFSRVDVTVQL